MTFKVEWGQGGASGTGVATDPGGSAPVTMWMLANFSGGSTFTGAYLACGTVLPDAELNAAGDIAVGTGVGGSGLENLQVQNTTFDAMTRTFAWAGTQGFNVGDSIAASPTTELIGLTNTSTYAMGSTAWPAYCAAASTCNGVTCSGGTCSGGMGGPFIGTDITDDDQDGYPGITARPPTGATTCPTYPTNSPNTATSPCSFFQPPTAVGLGGSSPVADQVYVVSRLRFAFTAALTSCSQGAGTANITLFDNHVVGCHIASGAACTSAQVQFLDQNRQLYADANNFAFSASSPTKNGAVSVYRFAQGATPTCADVRTMLP